jgi:hypothetical protein
MAIQKESQQNKTEKSTFLSMCFFPVKYELAY